MDEVPEEIVEDEDDEPGVGKVATEMAAMDLAATLAIDSALETSGDLERSSDSVGELSSTTVMAALAPIISTANDDARALGAEPARI